MPSDSPPERSARSTDGAPDREHEYWRVRTAVRDGALDAVGSILLAGWAIAIGLFGGNLLVGALSAPIDRLPQLTLGVWVVALACYLFLVAGDYLPPFDLF